MIKYLIFLDDERNFEDVTWINYPEEYREVIVVRTMADFECAIYNVDDLSMVDFSFDHDIQDFDENGEERTGYTCAKHLCEFADINNIDISKCNVIVHSQNPIGRENILKYVDNFRDFMYGDRK